MIDRLYMASAIIAAIAISVGLIALIKAWADRRVRGYYKSAGVDYPQWINEGSPRVTPDRRRQHRPRHLRQDCNR
jgi:hypothetical protein